ncbi:MAG: flavin reductase family protein [Phycisphaeraceae bacterium]
MKDDSKTRIGLAMGRIPQSIYVMTSHFEDRMRGVLVTCVQQMAHEPPMIMVALPKGRPIIPLIHDSHSFALCQIARNDKLTLRRFSPHIDAGDNAFEALETTRGITGSPILKKALAYLDCELVRHIDVDADHDIYVGLVRDGNLLQHADETIVQLRDNGLEP